MGKVNKKKPAQVDNSSESEEDKRDIDDEDFHSLSGNGSDSNSNKRKSAVNDSSVSASKKPKKGSNKKSKSSGKVVSKTSENKKNKEVEEENGENDDDDNDNNEEENDKEDDTEYEIQEVVGVKTENGIKFYRIRWKGYSKEDDTWEPEETLSCHELIAKFEKKQNSAGSSKVSKDKKSKSSEKVKKVKDTIAVDPTKEWEVEKIIDYAREKDDYVYRIRWKKYGPKHDTWEPRSNLFCDDLIEKFHKRMKDLENVSFKELREEPRKTKRLVNETQPRTNYHNAIARSSKRNVTKKRVYYGDSDE